MSCRRTCSQSALHLQSTLDDQKFIDLAVAHAVPLLSKDAAISCMKKRLSQSGVVLNPSNIPAQ
jgi:hypothetical protein